MLASAKATRDRESIGRSVNSVCVALKDASYIKLICKLVVREDRKAGGMEIGLPPLTTTGTRHYS
jgi:hypothetical protein